MARASCGIVARLPVLPHRCQQVRAFSSCREDAASIGRRVLSAIVEDAGEWCRGVGR